MSTISRYSPAGGRPSSMSGLGDGYKVARPDKTAVTHRRHQHILTNQRVFSTSFRGRSNSVQHKLANRLCQKLVISLQRGSLPVVMTSAILSPAATGQPENSWARAIPKLGGEERHSLRWKQSAMFTIGRYGELGSNHDPSF